MNLAMAHPKQLGSLGALVPLTLGACAVALAEGAAPRLAFNSNPLSLFCAAVCIASCGLMIWPRLFGWGWETKYFGVSSAYIGSVALLGVIPCLTLVFYGTAPWPIKACIALTYITLHARWCWRFVLLYRRIHDDPVLCGQLYQEDDDAVYYLQKGDRSLIEKTLKFEQFPSNTFFISAFLLSLAVIPFMSDAKSLFGIPVVQIMLTICALPVSMMGLGLATRGWLVFYHYPGLIKKATGKQVYVDMDTKPPNAQK